MEIRAIIHFWKILICLCLLVGLWSGAAVRQASADTSGNFEYTVSEGKATITSYSGPGGDVVIPDTLGGNPVVAIGAHAFDSKFLSNVSFPATVTTIGDWAFGYNLLDSLFIPGSVKTIENSAFQGNPMTELYISDGVTSIGEAAFQDNILKSLTIPGSVKTIGNSAFQGNELTNLVLSEGVTSVGEAAFQSNQLTSLTIPGSVTTIGKAAFLSNQLTSLTLSDGVTNISERSFEMNKLTDLTIPASVKLIGSYAFASNQLTSLDLSDGQISIGEAAFIKNRLTSLTIPGSLTTIGKDAFQGNQLTNLVLSDGVISVGEGVFQNNQLTKLTIPDSLTTIGTSAFKSNNLTSLTIPGSVKTIGDSAFDSNQLTSLVLSEGITNIGKESFRLNQLTSLTIPDSLTTIGTGELNVGTGAFSYNDLTSITFPDDMTTIGEFVFDANNLAGLNLPDSLRTIGKAAFRRNQLTSLNLPDSLTTIGSYAFQVNPLTSLDFPESVTTIGDYAFGNNQLTSLNFPESLRTIGGSAFFTNQLTSLTIPSGVTKIDYSAFSNNPLTNVIILGTGLSLGDKVFDNSGGSAATITALAPSSAKDYATKSGNPFINLLAAGVHFAPNGASAGEGVDTTVTVGDPIPADLLTTLDYKWSTSADQPSEGSNWTAFTSGDLLGVPNSTNTWYLHIRVAKDGYDSGFARSEPFRAKTYTVTFDSQGGSAVASATDVSAGAKISEPTAPTREGYTFAGWYKEASGVTPWIFATDTVSANVTLYAKWTAAPVEPETYTVTFDSQGGSAVASATDVSAGAKISEPTAPTREGYTFAGWYKEASGMTPWIFATDTVSANVTLYAKWTAAPVEPETYTVTFDSQGGSAVASATDVSAGAKISEPTAPTREGYTFAGWYKEASGMTPWIFATDTVSANVTLYAKWTEAPVEPETYTVTFDSQGGSAVASATDVSAGAKISEPTAPTRAGYTFAGWYKEAGGVTLWIFATDTVSANVTLYASWLPAYSSPSSPSSPIRPDPIYQTPVQPTGPIVSKDGSLSLPAGSEGQVSLGDEISIEIPSNAITQALLLKIEKRLSAEGLLTGEENLVSSVFEVLKNFPENFSAPIKLTFRYDPSKLGEGQKPAIFYYDETMKEWVEIGGITSGEQITAEVDHFTNFAVFGVDAPAEPEAEFSDIAGHWAETAIHLAANAGIATGYEDGSFKPNRTVTRAEFAVMLMNMLKPSGEGSALEFKDSSKIPVWARNAIAQAVSMSIINGYGDGTFKPGAEITRAEMAALIANALKLTWQADVATTFADDADIPAWAKGAATSLQELGVMEGMGENLFSPDSRVTRAQAVTILIRVQDQLQR